MVSRTSQTDIIKVQLHSIVEKMTQFCTTKTVQVEPKDLPPLVVVDCLLHLEEQI